jgi:hypothetical protein
MKLQAVKHSLYSFVKQDAHAIGLNDFLSTDTIAAVKQKTKIMAL